MEADNQANYLETTKYFSSYFTNQISNMQNHAINISLDRKLVRHNIETSVWNTIEAATETLVDYKIGVPMADIIGVYFKGSDYVLTTNYKYNLERFAEFQAYGNTEVASKIINFLTTNHSKKTVILSSFDKFSYRDAKLYVGVTVSINNLDDTLIFYVLDYNSLEASFLGATGHEKYGLSILDSQNTLLYTNGSINSIILDDPELKQFLSDQETIKWEYTNDQQTYNLFKFYDQGQDKTFLTSVLQDEVQSNLITFYQTIKNTFLFIVLGLLLILVMAVYISYKPIYKLSKRVESTVRDIAADEITSIEQAFDRLGSVNAEMQETIIEQRMQLIDHILSKLLSGEHVEDSDMKWLERSLNVEQLFAMTVYGLALDNVQRELLINVIYHEYGSRLFIIDMLYERYSVFICTVNQEQDQDTLISGLEHRLKKSGQDGVRIGVGNLIDKLEDVRTSYLNSLSALETDGEIAYYEDLLSNLSSIEKYPAKEVLSFLNHIKEGNKDGALADLVKIESYISENVLSLLLERYISYMILDAFIKTLNQNKLLMQQVEIEDIIRFTRFSELKELLTPKVIQVCDQIADKKKSDIELLNEEIIKFVDEHYTDYDLSLLQIADHYNMSIYTLSRLFKEIAGIGFKEYVTIKRMEQAKHLLLTTEKKVEDIATEIGFGSASSFIRVFKSNYGVTPSKYNEGTNGVVS